MRLYDALSRKSGDRCVGGKNRKKLILLMFLS